MHQMKIVMLRNCVVQYSYKQSPSTISASVVQYSYKQSPSTVSASVVQYIFDKTLSSELTASKVPGTSLFLTVAISKLITAFEMLLFSNAEIG